MSEQLMRDEALAAPPIEPVLAGKYRIERALGEGGFAWVWLARHETIRSLRFAIKVLKVEHARNPEVARRFRREAETAAALQNRHVVRVVDYGETTSGCPFIVMEYVDGVPLDTLLARRGPLRPTDCARLTLDVLRALDAAHRFGIVHRDLKPANIYIVEEAGHRHPIARVLDFGIAKVMAGDTSPLQAGTQTVGGVIFCTPRYASPELLNGDPSPRSDLYALGHVMAEMLDGHAPFADFDNGIIVAAEQLSPRPVPLGAQTMSSGMGQVIARALEKDPGKRFATATDMANALQDAYRTICPNPEQEAPLALRDTDPARSPVPSGKVADARDSHFAPALPIDGAADSSQVPRVDDRRDVMSGREWESLEIEVAPVTAERFASRTGSGPGVAVLKEGRWIIVAFAALALFVLGVSSWLALAALGTKTTEYSAIPHSADMAPSTVTVPGGLPGVHSGEQLFTTYGCSACHSMDGSRRVGPSLKAIWNTDTQTNVGTFTVDDEYLRESLLDPLAKVVVGYAPTMPSYRGRLNDDQIAAITEWLKSSYTNPLQDGRD